MLCMFDGSVFKFWGHTGNVSFTSCHNKENWLGLKDFNKSQENKNLILCSCVSVLISSRSDCVQSMRCYVLSGMFFVAEKLVNCSCEGRKFSMKSLSDIPKKVARELTPQQLERLQRNHDVVFGPQPLP